MAKKYKEHPFSKYPKKTPWLPELTLQQIANVKKIVEDNPDPTYILQDDKTKGYMQQMIEALQKEAKKEINGTINMDMLFAEMKEITGWGKTEYAKDWMKEPGMQLAPPISDKQAEEIVSKMPTAQIYYTLICLHDLVVDPELAINPLFKHFPIFIRESDNQIDGKLIKMMFHEIMEDNRFDELTDHNFEILKQMRTDFMKYL